MDIQELLLAIGRGLVKILTSLFIGFGVGLVTVGYCTMQSGVRLDFREGPPPMPETFLGVGAGLLAAGLSLVVLFFGSWARRNAAARESHRPEGPALPDAG